MNKKMIIFCVVVLGAILYWFYREGRLGSILPWAFIAVCPFMHLFMMKSMNHGDRNYIDNTKEKKNQSCH